MKAVVFVDVQKDFIDGALKNDKAIEVTPKIVEFAKECVKSGYNLYATRDTHEKTHYEEVNCEDIGVEPHVDTLTGEQMTKFKVMKGYLATLEGKNLPVEHCIEGTDGWMIDERLAEVLKDKVTIVNKPTFGSFDLADIINEDFFETEQEDIYTGECVKFKPNVELDEIILCGFCTDICVISNALLLRAKFPNTKITIMKYLCAGVTEDSHNAALTTAKMCQIDIV